MYDAVAGPALSGLTQPVVNQHGENVRLADQVGQVTVLAFFPLAFTPVCHAELGQLVQVSQEWQKRGVRLLASSVDSRFTLRTVADQVGVDFDLLSDFWPHGNLAQELGAFDPVRGHATRTAFVWNAAGDLVARIEADRTAERPLEAYEEALSRAGV